MTARLSGPWPRFVMATLQPAVAAVCLTWAPALPRMAPASLSGIVSCSWTSSGSPLGARTFEIACLTTPPGAGSASVVGGVALGVRPAPMMNRTARPIWAISPCIVSNRSCAPDEGSVKGSRSSWTRTRHSSRSFLRLSPPRPTTCPALSLGMNRVGVPLPSGNALPRISWKADTTCSANPMRSMRRMPPLESVFWSTWILTPEASRTCLRPAPALPMILAMCSAGTSTPSISGAAIWRWSLRP
mmetsp:Transcript_15953/g.48050  ORF Transcript_15953/g.48050 Transcript_15953/m.48050 type:complete len:244 (-) Transcript_15953:38-769(-)